jgi:ATP-dependent RNA helicase RhlE
MQFTDLSLIDPILKSLREEGYDIPTPIQSQAIPIILQGQDLLGCAQTGTGKTAAFAIPILQQLQERPVNENRRKIRCLVLTPTRELAIQIGESFDAYGRHLRLRNTVIFGGVGQGTQVEALNKGIDILVATPGRLLDLMNQGIIHLRDLEIFVLDEADRMLDMGFIHDVRRVIAALPNKRQSLFFSATMPPEIVKLADSILYQPKKVEVTPVSSTADTIQQYIYFVDKVNKPKLLVDVFKDPKIKTALVFTRTKHGADRIARILSKSNIKAEAIHGDKSQNNRQRALSNFKAQTIRALVATDIAARGIDVDELQFVINYDIPNIPETYVHRIGRTGRAGADGTAYSFCDFEEKAYLKDIEKLIGKSIPVIDGHDYPLEDFNPVKPPKPEPRPHKQQQQQRPQQQAQKPKQQNPSAEQNKPAKNQDRPAQEQKPKQEQNKEAQNKGIQNQTERQPQGPKSRHEQPKQKHSQPDQRGHQQKSKPDQPKDEQKPADKQKFKPKRKPGSNQAPGLQSKMRWPLG